MEIAFLSGGIYSASSSIHTRLNFNASNKQCIRVYSTRSRSLSVSALQMVIATRETKLHPAQADFQLDPKIEQSLSDKLPRKISELTQILRDASLPLESDETCENLIVCETKCALEFVSERDLEWFLLDRKLNVNAAAEKLLYLANWRYKTSLVSIETVNAEKSLNKVYLHNATDNNGRKVFIMKSSKHQKTSDYTKILAAQRVVQDVLDHAINEMESESNGQRECVLGILDLRGFGRQNADGALAEFLMDCFFKFYPKRMNELLLVDAPFLFRPTWAFVKPLLGKYSKMVKFVKASEVKEYFEKDQIPAEFM
mmetsp:Transcript_5668/g.9976  ORF Transcript_5668/g.9976 Transcript_5668/m.9976 type:complete len:313 (-) Transcript_5668:793-1731(-)|eukprot:CAMPEP_0182445668 /NCGR_PEP_ID=MMETSP1172-20130603/3717_1 /TAXON_ID=708627 /ORGANISM="Timspurckia oligopyrenoides, Strain CCMP3278" /LENGTH=312 /DNA_ID=CAMNT_0024641481 /DNA_START=120 /DNA_END=1058 /DNA_ORIENTATION=+